MDSSRTKSSPRVSPHFWRSEGERVSHIHAESLPTRTRSPSQPHFGPSHRDDAAKVAIVQQQFSFNFLLIFFYSLLFSFKFFSSRALASTQAVGGACRTFARRSDSPGPAGCAGCTQMPRPDCGPGATMKSPALLPPRRSLPLRWRCHVVESLMRVRRVSQLKSCDGDDFAPRLHGRGPEGSVRSC
jgi:hypothetical protein